jgi:serine/threonine protein kinase
MTKEASIGKYILYEQLSRGGCGMVYCAFDSVLKVECVIKVLHPALPADAEFLEHAHILPVYDPGSAYYTWMMDYVSIASH